MRQSGRTTELMKEAPPGSVYVWVNHHLDYPLALAQALGRGDLQIVSPSWLDYRWRGLQISGLVLDHAVDLTEQQWDAVDHIRMRNAKRTRT